MSSWVYTIDNFSQAADSAIKLHIKFQEIVNDLDDRSHWKQEKDTFSLNKDASVAELKNVISIQI